MAEMTADKVKTLLESFAALCGSNSKAKELCGESIRFVEQQQQQIERLKCCGNCKYFDSCMEVCCEDIEGNDGLCPAIKNCKTEKCNKWQGVE